VDTRSGFRSGCGRSVAGRLFTSESVTEGHPDKIADQISDAMLDDLLGRTRTAGSPVETLLTTGLVARRRRGHHPTYATSSRSCATVLEIGYDSSVKGFDGASCGVSVAIGKQSPDIAQGVDDAYEERATTVTTRWRSRVPATRA
jgi:S-adenosylmethionine synthetase